jgi:hypothetical protein
LPSQKLAQVALGRLVFGRVGRPPEFGAEAYKLVDQHGSRALIAGLFGLVPKEDAVCARSQAPGQSLHFGLTGYLWRGMCRCRLGISHWT